MKTIARASEPDSYFRLVRMFPLRPLRTDADLESANCVALKLVASATEEQMDAGTRDYLDALSVLIQDAERDMTAALAGKVSAMDILKHLMEEPRHECLRPGPRHLAASAGGLAAPVRQTVRQQAADSL